MTTGSGTEPIRSIGLCVLMVWLSVGPGSLLDAVDPPDWKLAFSDDFERRQPGNAWRPLKGDWQIEKGWLIGKRGEILCALRFPGPQRLEYDARSAGVSPVGDHPISDLSAVLATSEAGYKGGYFFGFGSENNTCSKILARGAQIARYDTLVKPFNTHRVVCEWDGTVLTHRIDGKVVRRERPDERLRGPTHQMVGFYLWHSGHIDNVKVYTPTGKAVPPTEKKLSLPVVKDLGLLSNGSFEETSPGIKPPLPSRWYLQRWSHEDTIALITDAAQAHRGQRFMRLYAPGVNAMRLHNQRSGGMRIQPGSTYTIRAWARKQPGTSAMLTTEPGGKEFPLSDQWKLYSTQYTHPKDGGSVLGMYLAVLGGPADVDDISIVTAGEKEPVATELRREWRSLKTLAFPDRWTQPEYAFRLPVVVHESVGENAVNYPVNLSIRALFRSFRLDFVRPEKIKVVDPRSGKVIPHVVISGDRNPNLSGGDLLMFLADCPARSSRTYYIYLRDFKVASQRFTPTDLIPDAINIATEYIHRLAVNLGEQQARQEISGRMSDGQLALDLRSWTAQTAVAVLVSPDGKQRLDVPLAVAGAGHWIAASGLRLPSSMSPGIWLLEATFDGGTARAVSPSASVLVGNVMWSTHNAERVYEDEPPRYGSGVADVAAAGNQWESFQVALASENGLTDVSLRVTDLRHVNGSDRVPATAMTIDLIGQAYVIEGFRSGSTPDPLVPWQKEDVEAAQQRVALVTVKVPEGQPAGRYSGELLAENAEGIVARLSIKLEVFGFSLPSSRSFTVIYAASFRFSPFGKEQARTANLHQKGRFRFKRHYPSSENAHLAMLRLLGERHMTPFYYASTSGAFAIPWTYDKEKRTAELDFSRFDTALGLIESANLDVKYVFINPESRIRHHGGAMYAYDEAKREHIYGWHGTEMGRDMFYARVRPINEYLKKKGWSKRAVFYTNDEGFGNQTGPPYEGRDIDRLILQYSQMVHEVNPDFITFTADNASGNWPEPLSDSDAFAGRMSVNNAERFRQQGSEWWGLYNRMVLLTKPLTVPRVVGLDCYFRGWSHHFQLAMFYSPMNPWINPRRYNRVGDKNGFFVAGGDVGDGFSHMAYPWPPWREPLPGGTPTLLSSLRLEALRESIDDYEYVKMLVDAAEKLPRGDPLRVRCGALKKRLSAFVTTSNVGDDYRYGGAHGTFLFDGHALDALLRETARTICEVDTQTGTTDR